MPFAKSRSRPDRSQRKAKLHKRIVSTNYAVPTGNLDKKNTVEIVQLLKEANEKYGQTIIMITHDEEIAENAERKIAIEDGKIILDEVVN